MNLKTSKRYLAALGITPKSVDCEALYDEMLRYSGLEELITELALKKMKHLGYRLPSPWPPLNHRDAQVQEGVLKLLGAQNINHEENMQDQVKELLAEEVLKLTGRADLDPERMLILIAQENAADFVALLEIVAMTNPARLLENAELEDDYLYTLKTATQAMVGAEHIRQSNARIRIDQEKRHPAYTALLPQLRNLAAGSRALYSKSRNGE
jgi:hypothetical protein